MQIFIDIAQAKFDLIMIKDISNEDDMAAAFSPNGKDSVYASFIALKHSSESAYRYLIGKNGTIHFPQDVLEVDNADFKEMGAATAVSGGTITNPSGATLLTSFKDGIYQFMIGYGVAGPTNNSDNILANKTYYATEQTVTSFGTIQAGGILQTTGAGTLTSGDLFLASETGSGVILISAGLQKKYAAAISKLKTVSSDFQRSNITNLLNDFRIAYERTKVLVIADSYTEAVDSFDDAVAILDYINSLI